jgi:molecular chaperone IbpA
VLPLEIHIDFPKSAAVRRL